MVSDITVGIRYLLQGFRLITKSGLRKFFLIPLCINITIFTVLIWLGIGQFGVLMDWLLPTGEDWWAVIARVVLWLLFALSSVLIMFFSFTMVANLIGSPFNGLLSQKVEEQLSGQKIQQETDTIRKVIADILPSILNELRKLVYFLICSALILTLSFVPVVNIAFPFIWIIFASWMLSLEYMSYPMENRGLRFKEVRGRLTERRMMSFGFGLAVMCATLIPLINFLIMPAAVAGATAMWVEHWKEDQG